jgi:hypothetical protein
MKTFVPADTQTDRIQEQQIKWYCVRPMLGGVLLVSTALLIALTIGNYAHAQALRLFLDDLHRIIAGWDHYASPVLLFGALVAISPVPWFEARATRRFAGNNTRRSSPQERALN